MRAILKKVGRPPKFIDVTSSGRIAAVQEVLGLYVAPVFYSQSVTNSFCIAYDDHWQLKGASLNFFATILRTPGYPITPVYGDALFVRTKPITEIAADFVDYQLIDCTDSDMDYLRTFLLRSATQHELHQEYKKAIRALFPDSTMFTPYFHKVMKDLFEWKRLNPKIGDGILGEETRDEGNTTAYLTPRQLKGQPLDKTRFTQHCESIGVQCAFHSNMVMLQTNISVWRIFREGQYVTQLSHENYLTERAKALGYTIPIAGFHLHELGKDRNIYRVVDSIVKHDEYRWYTKQKAQDRTACREEKYCHEVPCE